MPPVSYSSRSPLRILVLGGYGFFGQRLVRRLVVQPQFEVIVAGRSLAKADQFVASLNKPAHFVRTAAIDANDPRLAEELKTLDVQAVVHTAGPFQSQDYAVARACIAAGVHYIDLADGRDFVCGITALNEAALEAGVSVISGASAVPALSSAAVDELAQGLSVTHIDIGIHPGNKTDRGVGTVAAVLSYCGEPIRIWREGGWGTVPGWSKHWRHQYPQPVGARWVTHCDVPDLELFPSRYPGVQSVRFGAGLELKMLHGGLALLAWLHRLHLLPRLSRFAEPFKRFSDLFKQLGTDTGGMYVKILGIDAMNRPTPRLWQLVAERGDGPYVPILAAHALLQKFAQETGPAPGAKSCIGILGLADFCSAAEGLAIEMKRSA